MERRYRAMFRRRKQSDFAAEIRGAHCPRNRPAAERGTERRRGAGRSTSSFGNATAAEERFYERSRWLRWDEIRKDVGYALRTLRHNPAFTSGGGAHPGARHRCQHGHFQRDRCGALRPLPYPNPDTIVMLYSRYPERYRSAGARRLSRLSARQQELPAPGSLPPGRV